MADDPDKMLAKLDLMAERILAEEEELRSVSPMEGALGQNQSDYRTMWDLYSRLFQDAVALRADPKSFITASGQYNDKVINAYAKLMGLAMKGIESLNKMRNNDRMIAQMLNDSARDLSQQAAVELGVELSACIDMLDAGADREDVILRLKRLKHKRLPEIFLKTAGESIRSVKESHGLLN